MVRDLRWVKDIFKRNAPLENAVEAALKEQLVFEESHPVPFDGDQRRVRLLQTVRRRLPKANVERAKALIDQALEAAAQRG